MGDEMDIVVSDKQLQQLANELSAADDMAGFLTAASSSNAGADTAMASAPAPALAPSGGAASAAASANKKKSIAWNIPKHRDEVDGFQSRLVDQGFTTGDFGDPLSTDRPLEKVYSRTFAAEAEPFFAQLEQQVDELIATRGQQTA